MVGTCCALYLQREVYKVTLVDRKEPGEEASFGNLACFGIASCVPPGMPGILKKVPGMLMDADAPLKLRWSHAPKATPWFIRFALNTTRKKVEAIAKARQSLLDQTHAALDPLVEDAGAQDLINDKGGLLFTFESEEAFEGSRYAFDIRRRNGVELNLLTGNEAREMEPAITDKITRAYHCPVLSHTYNPGNLVKRFAQLFVERGGTLLRRDVQGFDIGSDGVRSLKTNMVEISADGIVIAAGVWSRPLAKMLGTNVPLEAERGYHTMYHGSGVRLNSSVLSVDRYISATPMDYGVRIGGTAEFAPPDSPPNQRAADMVRRLGEHLVPGLKTDQGDHITQWVGSRPSHPDSKAAIGPSPKQRNVWFAFGHDHLGLTMGPITGKLISEIVAGKPASVDLAPFRPNRF